MEVLSVLNNLGVVRSAVVRDNPSHPDTSETIHISSLALLKMVRHARSGVPMEVMGLMLGEFVDDYTINVVDVFAMPQTGTGVSVEAVDPVFQEKMSNMLKITGRSEIIVGWYHSHPGFGCWLSSVDIATQQSFETLNPRAVAVVIDPIKSVKGKVVIDAFRSITSIYLGRPLFTPTAEPRETTSNLGHLARPTLIAVAHGFGTRYYSLSISYRLGIREQNMLQCLKKHAWDVGLHTTVYKAINKNETYILELKEIAKLYAKEIVTKQNFSEKEIELRKVGKLDPKRRMEDLSRELINQNIVQILGEITNTEVFH